jgi:soluble lytic murein transglycosylase-like protein
MQIKPSTAADRNVGINDVSTAENNIHAGTKYMRFIEDRYFSDPEINDLNRWLFSLAAYNAGPAKIDHVEIIVARRIGRETVAYVSNIYRYFLGYRLSIMRSEVTFERYGEILTFCEQ